MSNTTFQRGAKRPFPNNRNSNSNESSQKNFENQGFENGRGQYQKPRGKQFQSRNRNNYDGRSTDQKHPAKVGPNDRTRQYSSNSQIQCDGTSMDSHQNETQNIYDGHTTKDVKNNIVPIESGVVSEVPRDPDVGYNLKNIKVIGVNKEFDNLLKRMLDSHPDKDKFLHELKGCSNVSIETFDAQSLVGSALSVNAPEFQMPRDQGSSEPVNSISGVKQTYTNNRDAEQDLPTNIKNNEVSQQSVPDKVDQQEEEEEEEGAVGGIRDEQDDHVDGNQKRAVVQKPVDAWDKTGEGNWADDEEKENLPTENQQFKDTRPKYDRKRNNRNDRGNQQFRKLTEVSGDLFAAPKDNSLAHCVGADMRMGSGIAVTFRRDFKNQADLLQQRKGVGQVAVLEDEDRFIYYLVTKKYSIGKPYYEDLERSLKEMKDHCVQHGVKKVSMPRIGCGLDRLEWTRVKPMIEEIFSDVDIAITVYNYNSENEDNKNFQRPKCKFLSRAISLLDIESETGLVFFGAEDGSLDDCGQLLDKKYNFALDYRREQKQVGSVLLFQKKMEYIYGLVIKKKESDPFSYINLEKCLVELKKKAKKDKTDYIGFQAFCDPTDEVATEKCLTLVRNVFFMFDGEVHICYPESLQYLRQGDEAHESEGNKNSDETTVRRGDRKPGFGNWNQQGGDRRKDMGGERKGGWNQGGDRKRDTGEKNWRK